MRRGTCVDPDLVGATPTLPNRTQSSIRWYSVAVMGNSWAVMGRNSELNQWSGSHSAQLEDAVSSLIVDCYGQIGAGKGSPREVPGGEAQ